MQRTDPCSEIQENFEEMHCVKSVQIRGFVCPTFSRIWTEYGDLRSKSPYLVRIRENTDHKKLRIWTLFTQWWFWTRAWCSKELLKWKYKGGRVIFPINSRFQCCNCIEKKTSGKFKEMFLKNYFLDLQINNECYLDLHRSEIFYKNFFHANRSWLTEKIKQNYRLQILIKGNEFICSKVLLNLLNRINCW